MFERTRSFFARAAGLRSRHPPPRLREAGDGARLCAALASFHRDEPERYRRFFLAGMPVRERGAKDRYELFEAAGLASSVVGGTWMPCVRVIPFEGHFVAADLATHRDPDQVFSPMFEQVYTARRLDVAAADEVLELGVGSGVLSLAAAAAGAQVTAVDLHERALAFAALNRDLNDVTGRIDLRRGSLFEPIEDGQRFDLILTNPPFEPVPPGAEYYHHSAGGTDGLDVVRAILRDAPSHLAPGGRLAIVTWSPGSEGRSRLEAMLREAFPAHRLELDVLEVWPIEEHLVRFRQARGYADWRAELRDEGLTHLHFLFVRALPAAGASIERRTPTSEVAACHAVADEWA